MQANGPQNQFVLFKIGLETYAVDIAETQEVLRFRAPKKIPMRHGTCWVSLTCAVRLYR
jgi:chemotaxis signal transduction protein